MFECRGYSLGIQVGPQYFQKEECGQKRRLRIIRLSFSTQSMSVSISFSTYQVRKKNSLKDCVAVAGPLGVTHFLILSKTDNSVYLVSGHHTLSSPP